MEIYNYHLHPNRLSEHQSRLIRNAREKNIGRRKGKVAGFLATTANPKKKPIIQGCIGHGSTTQPQPTLSLSKSQVFATLTGNGG